MQLHLFPVPSTLHAHAKLACAICSCSSNQVLEGRGQSGICIGSVWPACTSSQGNGARTNCCMIKWSTHSYLVHDDALACFGCYWLQTWFQLLQMLMLLPLCQGCLMQGLRMCFCHVAWCTMVTSWTAPMSCVAPRPSFSSRNLIRPLALLVILATSRYAHTKQVLYAVDQSSF